MKKIMPTLFVFWLVVTGLAAGLAASWIAEAWLLENYDPQPLRDRLCERVEVPRTESESNK